MVEVPRPEYHCLAFCVSAWSVTKLMVDGATWRMTNGVPPEAKLINAEYDRRSMCFIFVFEHPSFDAVAEGCETPRRFAQVEQLDSITLEEATGELLERAVDRRHRMYQREWGE
jgi:hypothetical protein